VASNPEPVSTIAGARPLLPIARFLGVLRGGGDANCHKWMIGRIGFNTARGRILRQKCGGVPSRSTIGRDEHFAGMARHRTTTHQATRANDPHARTRRTRRSLLAARSRRPGRSGRTLRSLRPGIALRSRRSWRSRIAFGALAAAGQSDEQCECDCRISRCLLRSRYRLLQAHPYLLQQEGSAQP
jgi:hypothetical protein